MGLIPDKQVPFLSPAPNEGQLGRASSRNLLWAASLAEQDPEVMSTLDLVLTVLAGFLCGIVAIVLHMPGPVHKDGT